MFALTQLAGASSYTWNALAGTSVNTNWSTPGNWSPTTTGPNGPLAADTVVFGNSDTVSSPSTINNYIDPGFAGSVANISFVNSSLTATYHVTEIPAGATLRVTTNFVVGMNQVSADNLTEAFFVGGGTLFITATNLQVNNADDSARNGTTAYLNLSGLTNFIYFKTNGTVRVEDLLPGSGDTGLGGNLILAAVSNEITAANINLGTSTSAQSGAPGSLTLGSGTNIFNTSNLQIASQKSVFTVSGSGSGGGFRVRGLSGADSDNSVNISIGNKNAGGGSATITGSLLLNGVYVNIKANTLIVGENSGGTPNSSGDGGVGILQFDTGNISANSVIMADNTSANFSTTKPASCVGTLDVGANATLTIGASSLFYLASAANTGPSVGNMIISNGLVNCLGPIVLGAPTYSNLFGNITFQSGGELSMGPNSYVGVVTNPISSLTLATNSYFQVSIPSVSYTNICVMTNNWPTPDTGMTFSIAAMPASINPTPVFGLLNCTNMTGTFNNPILSLPPGVQGYLSFVANAGGGGTIYLNITGGAGPGVGGVNYLLNSSFEQYATNWTTAGGASVVTTNGSNAYPNTGGCTANTELIQAYIGTNSAKLTGSFVSGGSTNSWSQSVAVSAGSTFTAGGFTYISHNDIMSGQDSFYYEVDFLNSTGALVGAVESTIVTNETCGGPNVIPLDTWSLVAATNIMQVTGGVNTGVVLSNVPTIFRVPPQAVTAKFSAIFIQRNASDTGSAYFDDVNLGWLSGPVQPTISTLTPNLTTLCTNTALTCTASSTETTISSVQVTATTTTLGGTVTNTTTYTNGSSGLTVTNIGTSSAGISLALATNTIYLSVVVQATDADGLTVSSGTVNFDTLAPNLVIEASDFNYTSGGNSGLFIDTPANGGLALYTNLVGMQGIDENKIARTNTQSYYRPSDATIIQAASPTPPSGTEQKFITSAANGDTRDIEVAIAYDTSGDWQNYSRTFGTNGTYSAQPGTYNVWCYLATSGSGLQVAFSQVTNSPAATGQMTNFIGNFGSSTFSDNGYANFVYAPLLDKFGNRVALTVTNGVQTFRAQIEGNDTPNVGFYMFVPVAPIYTPVLLNVYPNGPNELTTNFTFTVGPAQGAAISTNGIGLVLNGVAVSSGLSITSAGNGAWTVNYAIQSNEMYTAVINVTNTLGLTFTYSESFDTVNITGNYHWMAVDYDFSTNNGTGSGGSVGNGWTGGLFINNPVPTGDTNAPAGSGWQLQTNSYFGYPTGFYPGNPGDPADDGAVAQQSIDINWPTNGTQDTGGIVSNSIYRGGPYTTEAQTASDGVGTQIAGDSFLLPEFGSARTNTFSGGGGGNPNPNPDPYICEFNIGYFYATNWLNYTRTYPTGNFNVWGRLAAGAGNAFSGCTLSVVTNGVGTSNQMTSVLGTFSDPSPAGYQVYHWITLVDTNGNNVVVQLGGQATLRLTAPTNSSSSGGSLNPLFFMLVPATAPASPFAISASLNGGNIQISIPTQLGHNYTLWYAGSLQAASWTQVGSAITGDGTVHVVNQPVAGNQGFYQVKAQ